MFVEGQRVSAPRDVSRFDVEHVIDRPCHAGRPIIHENISRIGDENQSLVRQANILIELSCVHHRSVIFMHD